MGMRRVSAQVWGGCHQAPGPTLGEVWAAVLCSGTGRCLGSLVQRPLLSPRRPFHCQGPLIW